MIEEPGAPSLSPSWARGPRRVRSSLLSHGLGGAHGRVLSTGVGGGLDEQEPHPLLDQGLSLGRVRRKGDEERGLGGMGSKGTQGKGA